MSFVYILECADGSLYTGWTNNLAKRLSSHSSGKGGKYTRARLPVRLVYFETLPSREEAMSREWHIKKLDRSGKLRIINERSTGMYYNGFDSLQLSALGFGTMRLPTMPGGTGKDIDQAKVDEMVAYALENGINYFDTAWPYHEGVSENSIGKALSVFPRDTYFLADKYPGHQIMSNYDPERIFEEQLKKCGVDYFDFYLMHNVNENSLPGYLDASRGVHDYFKKQKELGRIKHLGFSCHGDVPCMEEFLKLYGDIMEFCQIQLNFLDWTLQDAKSKYEFLCSRNLPVWVMEPVRGGRLTHFDEATEAKLKELRPDCSIASWGFRWLQGLPGVTVVLSGMSSLEQMKDNVATFSSRSPLNEAETDAVLAAAETLKSSVPCTGCRYCCDGCPAGLEIPKLIALYNDYKVYPSINISMKLDALGEAGNASACIGCGQCASICPQSIQVPALMSDMAEAFKNLPDWAEVCRKREEAEMAERQSR